MLSIYVFVFISLLPLAWEADKRVITTLKYSKRRMLPKVAATHLVRTGQVPYIVSIKQPVVRRNKTIYHNICGGSIIDKNRIVTAAHCFEKNNYYEAGNFSVLLVYAGSLENNKNEIFPAIQPQDTSQVRHITDIMIHSEFMFPLNDVAIVFVSPEWKFNAYVNYIAVARSALDYSTCATAGYGKTVRRKKDKKPPELFAADVLLLTRRHCALLWEVDMDKYICSRSIVKVVSARDAGGPLVCRDTGDAEEETGKDLLVGVICGKNFDKTTLYTRLSTYVPWIENLKNFGRVLKCNFTFLSIAICQAMS